MGKLKKLKEIIKGYFNKVTIKIILIEYMLVFILYLLASYYNEVNLLKNIDFTTKTSVSIENGRSQSNIKILKFNDVTENKNNLYKKYINKKNISYFKLIIDKNLSIRCAYFNPVKKIIIVKIESYNKILSLFYIPLIITFLFWLFLTFFFKKFIITKLENTIDLGMSEILTQLENFFKGGKLSISTGDVTINESYLILNEIKKFSQKINENLNYNKKSKTFWKSILDNINQPIILINKDSMITYGNKLAKDIYGRRVSEKTSIYGIESLKNVRENIYNSINNRRKFVLNKIKILANNGEEKIFDFFFIPFGDNNQWSFALIGKEISEILNLKTNFDNLIEIEERGVLLINDSGNIIHFNKSACNLFKCRKEDVKKINFFKLFNEKEKEKVVNEFRIKKTGEFNTAITDKKDNYIPIKIKFNSTKTNGEKTIYMIFEDIGKKIIYQKEIAFYKSMGNIFTKLTELLSGKSNSLEMVFNSIGEYFGYDKIIIIDLETDKNSLSLFYELNINSGKIPKDSKATKININTKIDRIPPLKYSFNNIYFFDINSSPKEVVNYLKFKNIQSLISYPISVGNKKIRFLVFENFSRIIKFTQEEKRIIISALNVIAGYFEINNLKSTVKFTLNKYLSIFDKIDFPVYLTDIDTYEIVFMNNAMRKILYPNRENTGKCYEIIYKKKKICPHCILKDKNNNALVIELKDNFYLISQKIISLSKSKSFVFTSMVNITEKRIYEKKIQISQKLELLGQFAGGFVHDMNNILAGILGNIQMLELTKDEKKGKKYIDRSKSIIDKAIKLAQHVLNFSRDKEEKREIIFVNKVLEDAIGIAKPSISKNIEIESKINGSFYIEGKENQLLQVFLNIIINARDALDKVTEGGKIKVILTKKTIGPTEAQKYGVKSGSFTMVEINDNGIGMDRKTLSKIFEPFFTTKEKDSKKGTGIGLSTAVRIIKEHNGFINVKSSVGKGTSFFINLPLHKKSVKEEGAKEEKMIPKEIRNSFNGVLLLVEDEKIIGEATQDILEYMGFNVLSVEDIKEAKELIKKNKIDIVLLDMQLKENSAEQLLKYLNKRKDDKIRTIVLTSYIDEELTGKLKKYDSPLLIKKPFSIYRLAKEIKDLQKF